jgi:hypothetical protein
MEEGKKMHKYSGAHHCGYIYTPEHFYGIECGF